MCPKALVTGATGFIGSHLVDYLVAQEWKVTCLVREMSRTDLLQKLPLELIRGKTDDRKILEEAVRAQDYVFHLAGRIRSASREVYHKANWQFSQDLAQACLHKKPSLKRFVLVSSISAAGPSPPSQYGQEDDPPSPTSEYGRSKLRAEKALQKTAHLIPLTIIRPPNVYGPRQQETKALTKLIKKRVVPLLKDRPQKISLIYVQDLIQGMVQAAVSEKAKNQIYYLTDGKSYSWREIILALKRAILQDSLFLPLPEELILASAWLMDALKRTHLIRPYFGLRLWRAMTQTSWLFSSSKAKRDFGFQARYTLEQGIEETVKYYLH